MMKKFNTSLIFSFLVFSFSKYKVDDSAKTTEDLGMAYSDITNIYAIDDVAEQTPEEAKKPFLVSGTKVLLVLVQNLL